ncbi:MAG: hypothetical protein LBO67_06450 [Spirochaetaceae bacterium]|jgi:hypothetical protein|nr:hypothetical protein [Spirochaetaceae bacterium]
MSGKHYIPTKESEFFEWSENLIKVSTDNKTLWALPEDKLSEIQTLHGEAKALYEKCKTASYTKIDMEMKREKLKGLKHLEEVFVKNNLQNNDKMTDAGRTALRIPIYDTHPTPHPKPDTIPETELETPHPRVLRIKFRDEHAARWGKPENVHGLECLWVIAETPPAKVKDLLHSEFATKSPLELTFEEDERGKRVYFAVRWENGTVKKGDWSEIYSAIIP